MEHQYSVPTSYPTTPFASVNKTQSKIEPMAILRLAGHTPLRIPNTVPTRNS
ncbi:uncharacterized protein J3R85_019314 [Psidium guajava]|nr:uncharacterized protein J3R85_019314 [Psidium guajava]